jgi:N-acetylglucosaminyl-diphospho-decaprenol L-rhamnosyltransferase
MAADMDVVVSYCIVNTEQRALLLRCLDAVARERAGLPFATEVLVLDNASRDGSAGAARSHPAVDELVRLQQRRGKGVNDTALLQRARGRYCLLLNEDAALHPGATAALVAALEADADAAAAGAELLDDAGERQASAWRFPSPSAALLTAAGLHKPFVVQSRGSRTRAVDWSQSAALLVRRDAAQRIGWFDPAFFVYSDEVDFCKRLRDAGSTVLFVPDAQATHHERPGAGPLPAERRIVELSRNRDRYMRKHHGAAAAFAVRCLTAWTYAVRSILALAAPGHDPRRYRRHVTATLFPRRGEGLSEAAADFNRGPRL